MKLNKKEIYEENCHDFTVNLSYHFLCNAGSCPILIKEVDAKLAAAKELSEKQVAEIEKLRKEGEEAHNTGKHKESVKLLQEALAKLNI